MKSLASPQPQKHNSSNWISVSRVILACGGFERNEQMRVKYQRAPITDRLDRRRYGQHRRRHRRRREAGCRIG